MFDELSHNQSHDGEAANNVRDQIQRQIIFPFWLESEDEWEISQMCASALHLCGIDRGDVDLTTLVAPL